MEEQKNLMNGLLDEILRVKDIIRVYKGLPKNVGNIAIDLMEISIEQAKYAILNGDVVDMIKSYNDLKTYEL